LSKGEMKMKKMLLVLTVIILCMAGSSQAATIYLNEYITNPLLDDDQSGEAWTSGGPGVGYDYRIMETANPGPYGWRLNVGAVYWCDPSPYPGLHDADSSPYMMGLEGGGISSVNTTPAVTINDGDTVKLSWKMKLNPLRPGTAPDNVYVLLWDGAATHGFTTIPIASLNNDWQVYSMEFTHSGAALAAGNYVLGIDMYGNASYAQVFVDTFVPEPVSITLLAIGSLALIRRRRS
jgi:hypothetical protein